jgi:phospholipase C
VFGAAGSGSGRAAETLIGIHKVQHVIVIMQENRSFDSYFGTYPGAAGIPGLAGHPGTVPCVPDPANGGCVVPYHATGLVDGGGPHGKPAGLADINSGAMDGFLASAEGAQGGTCANAVNPNCASGIRPDVMGYHTAAEIPNYWKYAQNYVLQDRMFQSDLSWSLPSHLYMVSGWSAECAVNGDPKSCVNDDETPASTGQNYAWTDLTYLLYKAGVSWGYYVFPGTQPDCADDEATCPALPQNPKTPGIWNPLPLFTTVHQDGQLGNIQPIANFYDAARNGTLPAVSWVTPTNAVSEHAPASVGVGENYVTGLINTVMNGPEWDSTAIFLAWDDWGGFYDHVRPPSIDVNGYGLRVPGLVISPYAKKGYVDHQTLSFDAYLKFIEDDFLGGQRIDRTDGRPDPRTHVRETVSTLGDLANDFDFSQGARAPLTLPQQTVAPVPGRATGNYVIATILARPSPGVIKLQILSTTTADQSLLGQRVIVNIPTTTPIYFDGRFATSTQHLAVGDAVISVIVPNITKNYHAKVIDDLGP